MPMNSHAVSVQRCTRAPLLGKLKARQRASLGHQSILRSFRATRSLSRKGRPHRPNPKAHLELTISPAVLPGQRQPLPYCPTSRQEAVRLTLCSLLEAAPAGRPRATDSVSACTAFAYARRDSATHCFSKRVTIRPFFGHSHCVRREDVLAEPSGQLYRSSDGTGHHKSASHL